MKRLILNFLFLFISPLFVFAQNVGISADNADPHPSAILDVQSKDKGVLIPRVALQGASDVITIKNPATSLLIYNTTNATDLKPGFYYFNGISWAPIATANSVELSLNDQQLAFLKASATPNLDQKAAGQVLTTDGQGGFKWAAAVSAASTYWEVNGNAGTVSGTNFVGTTDNQALDFRTNNNLRVRLSTKGQLEFHNTSKSVYIGIGAGNSVTTGIQNNAVGYRSLHKNTSGRYNNAMGDDALFSNTTGWHNNAIGYQALYKNKGGSSNVANGSFALYSNVGGRANIAIGSSSLYSNTHGSDNSALGDQALYSNTGGRDNSAVGSHALYKNYSGSHNTAVGSSALYSNISGLYNNAVGAEALKLNEDGSFNTANGYQALSSNSSGNNNTASGHKTLYRNTTGYSNSAHGSDALSYNSTGIQNTANGAISLWRNTTGKDNSANGALTLVNNSIGSSNTASGSNALYNNTIGDCNTALGFRAFYTGSAYNNSTALGCNSAITASNQIRLGSNAVTSIGGFASWSNVSDARFKVNVKENVAGLDFINALRPVTYNLDMNAIAKFYNTPDKMRSKETEINKAAIVQTGFLAQEVEQAAKELGYNFSGVDAPKNENDHYALRYAEFTVPLVKAVQELSQKNQQLQLEIAVLKKVEAKQKTMEKELAEIKALLTTASK